MKFARSRDGNDLRFLWYVHVLTLERHLRYIERLKDPLVTLIRARMTNGVHFRSDINLQTMQVCSFNFKYEAKGNKNTGNKIKRMARN